MGGLTESDARMMLAAVVEPGDAKVGELITRHGAVETLQNENLLPQKVQQRKSDVTFESIKAATQLTNAVWITPSSNLWPAQLNDLGVLAPIGLWCLGNIE